MSNTAGKVARESWAYVWNHNKKEVLRAFLSLLRVRPLALFLLVLVLTQFSLFGLLGVILGFVISQLLLEILLQIEVLGQRVRIIRGFILPQEKTCPGFQLKKYPIKDFINNREKWEDINTFTISKFAGLLGIDSVTLDNAIHVYCLQDNENKQVLQNVTCFAVPMLGSHIVFNCEPEDAGWFQTFTLLHELAHSVLKPATSVAFSQYGVQIYVVFFVVAYFFISFEPMPTFGLILVLIIFLFGILEGHYIKQKNVLWGEIIADSFALLYLDKEGVDDFIKYESLIDSFVFWFSVNRTKGQFKIR